MRILTPRRTVALAVASLLPFLAPGIPATAVPQASPRADAAQRCGNGASAIERKLPNGTSWSMCWRMSGIKGLVLENMLAKADGVALGSRTEIFETFRKLHPVLKEQAFLNPKEEDDDPYESSQITALIANDTGIYGVYSYREVFDYDRFWAIGSGRSFALGAMYASWGRLRTAADLVRAGVEAGIEFDRSSAAPYELHTIKLKRGIQ